MLPVRTISSPTPGITTSSALNWAMQYADRIEVLAPEHVREEVKERIRKMKEKYGV